MVIMMTEQTIYHGHAMGGMVEKMQEVAPSFRHGSLFTDQFKHHEYPYLIDNGAFGAYKNGEEWDQEHFERMLENAANMPTEPDGVILPDVVGYAEETYSRASQWASRIEYPVYFPVQDGMGADRVAEVITELDAKGIFVGGTMSWKERTTEMWISLADDLGVKCHVARPKHFARTLEMGADSIDTTSIIRDQDFERLRMIENYPDHSSASETDW